MEPLPRPYRRLSGWLLAACAAIGLYLGASKSYGEGASAYAGSSTSAEGVASAKAIAPPPPPTFDEAAIRRIAKEEAQLLAAKAPAAQPSNAAPRKKSTAPARDYTTPSEAGLVYARPPRSDDAGAGSPPTPPSPPGQVEQF